MIKFIKGCNIPNSEKFCEKYSIEEMYQKTLEKENQKVIG